MFIGEYSHNLDEKNRLMIPSKFREQLTDKFILTRGLDGCLVIYSINEWENITSKLNNLPFTKKDARNFLRFIASNAVDLQFDKQGRIVIPNNLKVYSNIIKECVVIGVLDKIEIWSKENWNNFNLENSNKFELIAENLFNGESGDDDAL